VLISEGGYLSVWNGIRSRPAEEAQGSTVSAGEVIWRTEANIVDAFGQEVADAAFALSVGEQSSVIIQVDDSEAGTSRYYLILLNGKEVRPLDDATLQNQKREILGTWLENQRQISVLDIFERWRNNVPRQPILDPRFLVAPTPAPATPTLGAPIPVETPEP
jgi:hypothetical protein